jgi:hypothetical protein
MVYVFVFRSGVPSGIKDGILLAERVGFEPTVAKKGHNGFRDRPIQPLWHLSGRKIISCRCAKKIERARPE